ncbi:MAG: hypothetical protein QM658_14975, partial [Gordonia sp. (in: high G+C Gram-positive bacteria)]
AEARLSCHSLVGLGPYGTADTWTNLGVGLADSASSMVLPLILVDMGADAIGRRYGIEDLQYGHGIEVCDGLVLGPKGPGDHVAVLTNLAVGIDFRDFAGEDPWGTAGKGTFGAAMFVGTKGLSGLKGSEFAAELGRGVAGRLHSASCAVCPALRAAQMVVLGLSLGTATRGESCA